MKNILLIVDPQNDFITGTLAVEGAEEKMKKLADYISEKGSAYDYVCITLDSHPEDHCSFKENGGIWPRHCITWSDGWSIPNYLETALKDLKVACYHKGDFPSTEEYSIFNNEEDGRVLANQRGEGTPDFQGYWNAPCGYLDYNETTKQAAIREVYEETGVKLSDAEFWGYDDSPKANRQNVTFRFYSIVRDVQPSTASLSTEALGGEENEVESVSWIPVSNIKDFEWAFDHDHLINEIAHKLGLLN